jgi:hypothetical protein
MISSGIELATFHLVAQCLNQLRYGVPCQKRKKYSVADNSTYSYPCALRRHGVMRAPFVMLLHLASAPSSLTYFTCACVSGRCFVSPCPTRAGGRNHVTLEKWHVGESRRKLLPFSFLRSLPHEGPKETIIGGCRRREDDDGVVAGCVGSKCPKEKSKALTKLTTILCCVVYFTTYKKYYGAIRLKGLRKTMGSVSRLKFKQKTT